MPTLNTVFYSFCCHYHGNFLNLLSVLSICECFMLHDAFNWESCCFSYIFTYYWLGVAEWINEIVLYNVKHCFYLVGMVLGQHRYICLLLLPNTFFFFYNPLLPTFCILHDILFISVDELNDTIAANLSDTEFYGGELWWL